MRGNNDDFKFDNTGDALVDFFGKAGSLPKGSKGKPSIHYYDNCATALELFQPAFNTDKLKAVKLAMWLRDIRGGSGNRSGFRDIIKWLANNEPAWISKNIDLIPQVGRWDDMLALFGTPCESHAIERWATAILEKNGLACKWAPREKSDKEAYHKIRKFMKMDPKSLRKHISENTKVVETAMCQNKWNLIDYNHVPSVAMARNANAFTRHDVSRFTEWKDSLAKPDSENKVNAGALYPHDCLRTMRAELSNALHGGYYGWSRDRKNGSETYQDSQLANAQFAALPDYMGGNTMRIMTISDFSGSMSSSVGGTNSSIQMLDVSLSLALYCSDRLGKENPFYRKFIPFSNDCRFVDWRNETFSVAAQKYNDGFCGGTNIRLALETVLSSAKMFNVTKEQMPNCLLILSDMEFDRGANDSETAVESAMKLWEANGYERPRILFWNLGGYEGSPTTIAHKNEATCSGFSPSVLTAVLGGTDFSSRAIMERAIEKYPVVSPY